MFELSSAQIIEKIRKDISDAESKGFNILVKMYTENRKQGEDTIIPSQLAEQAWEMVRKQQNAVQTLHTIQGVIKSIGDESPTHIR